MEELSPSISAPAPPPNDTRLDEGGMRQLLGFQLAMATVGTNGSFVQAVGHPMQLAQVEFSVLYLIKQNPGMTPSALAQALAVTMPAITAWLGKLETRGLIRREVNPRDRRSQQLLATEEGAQLAEQALRQLLSAEAELLGSLSPAEQAMLMELLVKLRRPRLPG